MSAAQLPNRDLYNEYVGTRLTNYVFTLPII